METEKEVRTDPLKDLRTIPALHPRWPGGLQALWVLARVEVGDVAWVGELPADVRLALARDLAAFPDVEVQARERWEGTTPVLLASARNVLLGGDPSPPSFVYLDQHVFLRPGDPLDVWRLGERLQDSGYERVDYVEEPGQWARRGGILDVYPPEQDGPVRIYTEEDRVVALRRFDVVTQRSLRDLPEFRLALRGTPPPLRTLPVSDQVPLLEANPPFLGRVELFLDHIQHLRREGLRVVLYRLPSQDRLPWVKDLPPDVERRMGQFARGGIWRERGWAVLSVGEVYGETLAPRRTHHRSSLRLDDFKRLAPGDPVVHWDYGIGRFGGLVQRTQNGVVADFVRIVYRDGEVLLPVHRLDRLERYAGEGEPRLSSLSGSGWRRRQRKVQEAVLELARHLLTLYARRRLEGGRAFPVRREDLLPLEQSFPYEETPDQRRVVEEVLRDLARPEPMDRLVVGDVGFGKTEVALRAAYAVILHGAQVVLLVPTTLLALQHERTFRERLEPLGVRIRLLSRMQSRAEVQRILREAEEGGLDLLITTPRLFFLEPPVFRDLGLLLIDEEHRFGVRMKEMLRFRYPTVDTLRLTATPIPRTLYAALGKLHQMSRLDTPPEGRKPIETVVQRWDPALVRYAIRKELERGGQVFYIYNRIRGLEARMHRIVQWFPGVRVGMAHGRMQARELEEVFFRFVRGELDVLVATTLLEAGVDVPRANTLIVEGAERLGLAELHQLRGRVGRGTRQAFAYFLWRGDPRPGTRQRLEAVAQHAHLGSGFRLALVDLQLRGAGNLLGPEQHGTARMVGYGMFFRLLEEAITVLTEGRPGRDVDIVLEDSAFIPDTYIPDSETRLVFYRRLFEADHEDVLQAMREEMVDRFGPLPPEVDALFLLAHARLEAREKGYERIRYRRGRIYWTSPRGEVLRPSS